MLKVDSEESNCWFWSGEQQRLIDLVEAHIKQQEHSSIFFMKFNFRGDICLPPSAEPKISLTSRRTRKTKDPLHALVIAFNKKLWEEMRSGCYLFCIQIMDQVAVRLNYKRCKRAECSKTHQDWNVHMYEFIENTK